MIVSQIVIEKENAQEYTKSLRAIRKRLLLSFNRSIDMSHRKWVNKHGPVLDELIEELTRRG